MMRAANQGADFRFHHLCQAQQITHMSFADDMVIVISPTQQNVQIVQHCLEVFGEITGHLTCEDYRGFTDRIFSKINSWQARKLSFGGRAQLVRSFIFRLHSFWCASLPIPKYVIHEVEMKIRTFLWVGKEEGPYHLRDPWYWCKILKVRPLVKQKLQVSVGNGDSVFFWYDTWCALGHVWDYLDESERANLQVPLGAKLSEVKWVMSGARRHTARLMQVHAYFVQLVFSGENDKWLRGAGDFVSVGRCKVQN
ncbi:hypothetical protein LIER_19579 [Lithospermum erythrorhizon]|uniref:Uncharacterized protein n=1 Tax=Lithospermum erythrorhizon TaxID=34254 RepID=A0AAV3QJU0_LITER